MNKVATWRHAPGVAVVLVAIVLAALVGRAHGIVEAVTVLVGVIALPATVRQAWQAFGS